MPFFTFELGGMSKLAFQVADDPFYKSMKSKYYPEVVIMNLKGEVKARVNPFSKSYKRKGQEALAYEDDFREPRLKINDDKRVHINLTSLVPKNIHKASALTNKNSASSLSTNQKQYSGVKMILLTVKVAPEALKRGS